MNAAQTTKNIAQKIAQQLVQEPAEILKTAREQIAGEKNTGIPEKSEPKIPDFQSELQDKTKASRLIEAYKRELEDIRRERLFKELQRRIAEGEEIPLHDFPELSPEQKQVLKAQMEAYQNQKSKLQNQDNELQEPQPKRSRRLFHFGKKTEVKRQQTRVEKIMPPSG